MPTLLQSSCWSATPVLNSARGLFIHTVHLLTDWVDTLVLTVFAFMHDLERTHFSDVADNCLYWHFVALAWLPIYALLYWVPRMLK